MDYILDIETNGLLTENLDYSSLPYKLKKNFKVWCVVLRHVESNAVKSLHGEELTKENLKFFLRKCTRLIGHNVLGFDLPVLKLMGLIDYSVSYPFDPVPATLFGNPVEIVDTLLWSRLQDADRYGGHSLAAWGDRLNNYKQDFTDFSQFSQRLLDYCQQDTDTNSSIYKVLIKEMQQFHWQAPYRMEAKLADLILKQEVFGFAFDSELAQENIEELDSRMKTIAEKINPLLPPKRLPKIEAKNYVPPKIKFKKNGEISAVLQKFLDKHNASLSEDRSKIIYKGKEFDLQSEEPLETTKPATIQDIDVVKGYLLSLGWEPSEIRERDLSKNSDKSIRTKEEIKEAIDRYIDQTLTSEFKQLRLDILETNEQALKAVLLSKLEDSLPRTNSYGKKQNQKAIWVPASPKIAVGLEKAVCPNLEALGEKASFAKEVTEYFTYRHRRSAISGGEVDEDTGEPEKGFLSYLRGDGRVPTPAITLGANTGRFRHRVVCNIPRVTSLFGEQMRGMFGCGEGLVQLAFDFSSPEARIMGHYVLPFKDGAQLAESLLAEKPADLHSVNARKLGIPRDQAKSVSYAVMYGAQPKKLMKMLKTDELSAKTIFDQYWQAVPALKQLKDQVERQWEQNGKTHVTGVDGRNIVTRSKHSLINAVFQSGGAIAAKWTTVLLAEKLEQMHLLGDPFSDTITDIKVWYMINYHDEIQMAVHPSLLELETFETEEEAIRFQKQTPMASAVGHGKKYYVGLKNSVVEKIDSAIRDSQTFLKLKVPLGFEWTTGKNWAQTH